MADSRDAKDAKDPKELLQNYLQSFSVELKSIPRLNRPDSVSTTGETSEDKQQQDTTQKVKFEERGVFALEDIPRGTTVCRSLPLGIIVVGSSEGKETSNPGTPGLQNTISQNLQQISPFNKGELCDYCVSPKPSHRCSKCKITYYCSKDCQKRDWEAHKVYCGKENSLSQDAIMLIKVIIALTKSQPSHNDDSSKPTSTNKTDIILREAFMSLTDHNDERAPEQLEEFTNVAKNVSELIGPRNTFTIEEMVSFLGKFGCNNFTLHDSQIFPYGEGCYPIGALFNHSCNPNCIILYDGRTQIIRTVRDIIAGEELFDCYIDGMAPKPERDALLSYRYFFTCHCERCVSSHSTAQECIKLLSQKTPLSYALVDRLFRPDYFREEEDMMAMLGNVFDDLDENEFYQPVFYNQPVLPDALPSNIHEFTRLVLNRLTKHIFDADSVYRTEHKLLLTFLLSILPSREFSYFTESEESDEEEEESYIEEEEEVEEELTTTEEEELTKGVNNIKLNKNKKNGSMSAQPQQQQQQQPTRKSSKHKSTNGNASVNGDTTTSSTKSTPQNRNTKTSSSTSSSSPRLQPSALLDHPLPPDIHSYQSALIPLLYLPAFTKLCKYQYSLIQDMQWGRAATVSAYVLAVYLLVYERFHPMIGLQFFLVGKLVWNCLEDLPTLINDEKSNSTKNKESTDATMKVIREAQLQIRYHILSEAREFLSIAMQMLEVTHGDGSVCDIIDEVALVLDNVRTEMGEL